MGDSDASYYFFSYATRKVGESGSLVSNGVCTEHPIIRIDTVRDCIRARFDQLGLVDTTLISWNEISEQEYYGMRSALWKQSHNIQRVLLNIASDVDLPGQVLPTTQIINAKDV